MKRVLRVGVALILLFACVSGGFYLYSKWFGLPLPFQGASRKSAPAGPAETPEALPAPDLSGTALSHGEVVATLSGVKRTVKIKPADDLSWEDAHRLMDLYNNDAVRTFDGSTAEISFGENDIVEVEENSLVIIKPRSSGAAGGEFSLALLSAAFLDSLSSQSPVEQQRSIEQAAAKRQIRIRSASGSGAGKRRIKLQTLGDRSTRVTSLEGDLRLVGPGGKEVLLREKMNADISANGVLGDPRRLLNPPRLLTPNDGASYAFLRKAPTVKLGWKQVEGARSYRVVVSRDRKFRKIFANEKIKGTTFTISNLEPGSYYWRVRSRDADGFEGGYSSIRSLRAARDNTPPKLAILSPPEMFVSPGPRIELEGKTDGGARVKINGERIKVGPDGRFRHTISLREGINLVNIEATDESGNTEYGKRLITYKGSKRSNTAGVGGNQ